MKQKVFFLLLVGVTFLSYSQVNNDYYKEIDKVLVGKHYSEYKIIIPEKWFSYYTDPGMIAHSPNRFKEEINPNKTSVSFIIHKKNYKRKNVEKSLKSFMRFQNQFYRKFKYKLFEAKHKLYGKYYIVKYSKKTRSGMKIVFASILNWKKQPYHLFYISDESTFDEYLLVATRMINSFEIIEK